MNNKAFYSLSYGLYIVSAKDGAQNCACVVNTLQQVTAAPAQLSVTVNKDNCTARAIEKSGTFCATVIAQDISLETIGKFGFKSSADINKFECEDTALDCNGVPYLTQSMTAQYSCRVTSQTDVGSHITFVGEVVAAEVLSQEPVLTYAYYQTTKNGGTPKNAPSYKADSTQEEGFRCSVCGYILKSDTVPQNYKCPICSQGSDKFVKL